MIYSVTFHRRPGRKVLTYWFNDRDKAYHFYESVKAFPKAQDAQILKIPVCTENTYSNDMPEDFIRSEAEWKKED